ncbi:MAG: hypothetical protein RL398_3091 [Planctomycetota bacterium]|jgi:sialidase-1
MLDVALLCLGMLPQDPPVSATPPTAAPPAAQALVDVFVAGTHGYHTYRIPSLLRTAQGDLLAFAEGRKNGSGDSGDIDLVMRGSRDGGRTWTEQRVLWDDGPNTCGNPCAVVDANTGRILLLSTHNLGGDREPQIIAGTAKGTRTVWLLQSDDHGATWSKPREITAQTKRDDWTWYATGPGAGIQLTRGPHAGRIVIPCDHIQRDDKKYFSHVVYSDDAGATWTLGGSSPRDQVNECEVLERGDGSLLLNMRNYDATQRARQVCSSTDGGATWHDQRHDIALVEPICQASLRRITWPEPARPGWIAFSNPADAKHRKNLTLRLSPDDGATWPIAHVVYPGSAAYSCLVAMPDQDRPAVGCLLEVDGYRRIVFFAAPLEALVRSK